MNKPCILREDTCLAHVSFALWQAADRRVVRNVAQKCVGLMRVELPLTPFGCTQNTQ